MKHFPAKTCGQLNLQTQRLFGQQSLAEFYKLHIDPQWIKKKNDKIRNVQRKNGCIINTGDNMTPNQRLQKLEENRRLYEIKSQELLKIKVPYMFGPEPKCRNLRDKMNKAMSLWECLHMMKERLEILDKNNPSLKTKTYIQKETKSVEIKPRIKSPDIAVAFAPLSLKPIHDDDDDVGMKELKHNPNPNPNPNSNSNHIQNQNDENETKMNIPNGVNTRNSNLNSNINNNKLTDDHILSHSYKYYQNNSDNGRVNEKDNIRRNGQLNNNSINKTMNNNKNNSNNKNNKYGNTNDAKFSNLYVQKKVSGMKRKHPDGLFDKQSGRPEQKKFKPNEAASGGKIWNWFPKQPIQAKPI